MKITYMIYIIFYKIKIIWISDTNDARVFDGFCLKKLITFQNFIIKNNLRAVLL